MAESEHNLTQKEKIFCSEFIYDWNCTRAYLKAYPNVKNENVAGVSGHRLLRNPKIQAYIESIQRDIEKQAGISQMRVLQEYIKLAFNSIAHLHNTWIDRKEFEDLTEDQKACISEIDTKIVKRTINDEIYDVEQIKIKLYDKQKALESICRMLGYNAPEKKDITSGGKAINIQLIEPND